MKPRVACITFPGSNCDQDMHRAIHLMGWELVPVWHKNAIDGDVDLVTIPGGFSYGDYLRCGALARYSPAMASVRDHARRGGLVAGVCNGFQILCEAGLLPGALVRNAGLKFRCIWTHLRIATNSPFTNAANVGDVLRIPIAHGEGNYIASPDLLAELRDRDQIAVQYSTPDGELTAEANPNGATANIAGVLNRQRNVFGMMPHPERAMEAELGGTDGRAFFASMLEGICAKI